MCKLVRMTHKVGEAEGWVVVDWEKMDWAVVEAMAGVGSGAVEVAEEEEEGLRQGKACKGSESCKALLLHLKYGINLNS